MNGWHSIETQHQREEREKNETENAMDEICWISQSDKNVFVFFIPWQKHVVYIHSSRNGQAPHIAPVLTDGRRVNAM